MRREYNFAHNSEAKTINQTLPKYDNHDIELVIQALTGKGNKVTFLCMLMVLNFDT
jgi:hypothetical protein